MIFPRRRREERKVGKGIGLGVLGSALLLLSVGVWWGHRELLQLSAFRVSEIVVRGNLHLSSQEILDRLPLPENEIPIAGSLAGSRHAKVLVPQPQI